VADDAQLDNGKGLLISLPEDGPKGSESDHTSSSEAESQDLKPFQEKTSTWREDRELKERYI
jgi:hypothetical protein